jgi:phthiodiolone/phenolphthiodiolone dimycocerosates ketoreductase
MKVQPAGFLRTTLPLGLDLIEQYDSSRYHSIWLPDHMVSFWPDTIWTPEFTDLAITSHSPHRHLDAMVVAGAAAVLSKNVPIATSVIDTVRRHPAMIAQAALTVDHLSKGRFILGIGSGETENTVPYGFDFKKSVSRFEEALHVIKLLWESEGTVDFEGQFYKLEHARLDTDLYADKCPPIWVGCSGPRMLEIAGRYADGWWASGARTPDDYAAKLKTLRDSAERAGRDPAAIVPANIIMCLVGEEDEVEEMLDAPLVKSILLMLTADELRDYGYAHPMGPTWRGYQDINPGILTRERIIQFCAETDKQAVRDLVPHGTPKEVARVFKGFCDAGMRVFKVMDYGGMAGQKFAAKSARKVIEVEDEVLRLCGETA